ncbi:MAG: hypothetical protein U0800_19470 [Isosphaeraceae bacterium]
MAQRLARGIQFLEKPLSLHIFAARDLITALRPSAGGLIISQPYAGQSPDPDRARLVPGGWDHEHCSMCLARIVPGDAWWATAPPEEAGLCPDCHELLGRYGPKMRAFGLSAPRDRRRSALKQAATAMTEAEWLASTVPRAMLMVLEEQAKSGKFNRELRLFACACARNAWHHLHDERSRREIEVAERYADGRATSDDLDKAGHAARDAASAIYRAGGLDAADMARIEGHPGGRPDGAAFDELPEVRAWHAACAGPYLTARKVGRPDTNSWYEGGAWVAAYAAPMCIFEALADAAVLRAREAAEIAADDALEQPLTATEPIAGVAEILARQAVHDEVMDALRFYEDPRQAALLRDFIGNPFRWLA